MTTTRTELVPTSEGLRTEVITRRGDEVALVTVASVLYLCPKARAVLGSEVIVQPTGV